MDMQTVLQKVKDGEMSVEEAERYFRRQPYEEMGYAKLLEKNKIFKKSLDLLLTITLMLTVSTGGEAYR